MYSFAIIYSKVLYVSTVCPHLSIVTWPNYSSPSKFLRFKSYILLFQSSLHPHHSYLNTSLTVLLGMYLFFLIERLLKMMMDWRSRRRQADHQANLVLVGQSHHQTEQASLVQSPLVRFNSDVFFSLLRSHRTELSNITLWNSS